MKLKQETVYKRGRCVPPAYCHIHNINGINIKTKIISGIDINFKEWYNTMTAFDCCNTRDTVCLRKTRFRVSRLSQRRLI